MEKKEVMELKRRLKKETCTIKKLAGCYVDSAKEKVCTFTEDFLSLEEEEFFKYLEIANKALSGTVGNNLIQLSFPNDEELEGGAQNSLMGLKNSQLEIPEVNDAFFDSVIKNYDFVGNYLILVFYDVYDVPTKTTDNMKLDESEEVYDYVLCAVCPVKLTKAALGYREEENRIAPRIRDWAVDAPESGFLFPAFTDRSSDIHNVMMYTKNTKDPHKEFWENGLGCASKFTSTEKKNAFEHMIVNSVGPENEDLQDIIADVNQNISDFITNVKEVHGEKEPVLLTTKDVEEILSDAGLSEQKAEHIAKTYDDFFKEDEVPLADEILDTKVIKNNEIRQEKNALKEQVVTLTQKLEQAGVLNEDGKNVDIVLRVSEEKAKEIVTSVIDGQKCLVIPVEDNEYATVNGEVKDM
ncbi:MAG: DUF4317 domain-containing protein [Lachnospiraceae bacterium]|nr:DUF4317 domain-containing protein [Lachnospiraceae bacterium]